jgi:hypothetical protein
MTANRKWKWSPIDILGANYKVEDRCLIDTQSVIWVCRDQYGEWTYLTYVSKRGWDYSNQREINALSKRRITNVW